jgi:hypothetical protein
LSNPNGRALRLRISCDTKYQNIIKNICSSLKILLPKNRISFVKKKCRCVDISCYSNSWGKWLDWKYNKGPKYEQTIKIPSWIKTNSVYSKLCLKGLFQTDGSIYLDRGYIMTNFVTTIPNLGDEVVEMITKLGFKPKLYTLEVRGKIKHKKNTIRISKNVTEFIEAINLTKT